VASAFVARYSELCGRVREHIERRYGVRVITRDIPDPLIGDLDGSEIHIDCAVTAEQRLFLLAHLFGHAVQWNISLDAFAIGQPRHPPVDEPLLPAIMAYEREAASYRMALFHEIGIRQADQWLSDYTACDLACLEHYYRTGEKRAPLSFWRQDTPLVEPRAIPVFAPARMIFRSGGVVI
jgi:hypothetical protein